jgi:hypothetical protein
MGVNELMAMKKAYGEILMFIQRENEETQEELWLEVENNIITFKGGYPEVRKETKSKFTLTRRKQ